MKKVILGLLLIIGVGSTTSAQTQDSTSKGTKYWYYPSQNIYYNDATTDYWYYDPATTKWSSGKTLPSTINLSKSDQHYDVYSNGSDVWMDNKTHMKKYIGNKSSNSGTMPTTPTTPTNPPKK